MFARSSIENLPPDLQAQVRVCKLLGIAFGFSLVHISGLGSLIALVLGLRAWRLIKGSPHPLHGGFLLWWSLVAGAVGTLALLPRTAIMIMKALP